MAAVLAAAWGWWAARPEPPVVREEANELPVPWYADGELHLADVVVELRGVETFVADGSGAVARLRSGEVVRVAADGDVDDGRRGAGRPRRHSRVPPVAGARRAARQVRRAAAERAPARRRVGAPDRLLAARRLAGRRTPVRVGAPRPRGVPHGDELRRTGDGPARAARSGCGERRPVADRGVAGVLGSLPAVAEDLWTGVARAYARSFAGLCEGAVPVMLDGLPRGGRLLDVGCGTGRWSPAPARPGSTRSASSRTPRWPRCAGERWAPR